ncbi:Isopentenyldiphosphate isomerase [Flavobacteriaceae bacterium MAR_2010_188]|nr:Isopentenyldiphosphate isomerase [Flavobacteriaceae bacterium MAR_2010_188]
MDELIDVLTKEGKPTGEAIPKSIIHQQGLYHNTAHIWFYTKKGEILLAQRSYNKAICPGLWDVSVAGHVDADETVEDAAIREIREELGITITIQDLHKIGTFNCFQSYDNGIIDNEFHNTFLCEFKDDIDKIIFQKEEVEAVKLVTIDEFATLLANSKNNSHFVASNKSYYDIVIKQVKANLKN